MGRKVTRRINCSGFNSEKPLVIKMGGDPEFEAISKKTNNVVSAHSHFSGYGKIGCDCGNGSEVELRPSPKTEVLAFLKEFKGLVEKASKKVILSSKGDHYPVGGHVHFSINQEGRKLSYVIEDAARILDDFIGFTTEWSGKARGSYKGRMKYRSNSHGFEYRSVPSKVWEHPTILRIILSLSKALLEKGVKEGVTYTLENSLPTKEDYLQFISEDDYNTLMNWNKISPSHHVTINWIAHTETQEFPPSIILEFKDEWNEAVKETLKTLLNSVKVNKNLEITLFGLKKSRGEVVSGFNSSIFNKIEVPQDGEKTNFGFPIIVRNNNSPLCVRVLNILAKEITEKLKADGLLEEPKKEDSPKARGGLKIYVKDLEAKKEEGYQGVVA
jgi:hypothetical protein